MDLNRVNIVPVLFAAVELQTKQQNIIFLIVTYLLFLETVYYFASRLKVTPVFHRLFLNGYFN